MLDGLLRQVAAGGRTVLMTSHDLPRAADLATRIDILSRGVIAASVPRAGITSAGLIDLYRKVTHD
jgi:ABC-type multidrug transport system ATPase subunit